MNLRRIILSKYRILKMLGGETMANQSKNKLVVPGAKAAIDNMKAEIANELGVQMGQMQLHVKMVRLVEKSLNVLWHKLNNK